MSDVRLIDANALDVIRFTPTGGELLDASERGWNECISFLQTKAKTIDAVTVVRCRECKHWSGRNDKPGEVTAIGYCNHPNHHIMPLRADWFCADGEKIDGGADE